MTAPAYIRSERDEEQVATELDRAQRFAATLSDPQDQATIQRYIAELEARIRGWSRRPGTGADPSA